jgi:hypothetical protein
MQGIQVTVSVLYKVYCVCPVHWLLSPLCLPGMYTDYRVCLLLYLLYVSVQCTIVFARCTDNCLSWVLDYRISVQYTGNCVWLLVLWRLIVLITCLNNILVSLVQYTDYWFYPQYRILCLPSILILCLPSTLFSLAAQCTVVSTRCPDYYFCLFCTLLCLFSTLIPTCTVRPEYRWLCLPTIYMITVSAGYLVCLV